MSTMNTMSTMNSTMMTENNSFEMTVDNRNFFTRMKEDHPFGCGVAVGAAVATPITHVITKKTTEKKINDQWEQKLAAYRKERDAEAANIAAATRNSVYQEWEEKAKAAKAGR